MPTTSGDIDDVAAFCRVSRRTVLDWKEGRKITHFQEGRNIWFHESDVVAFELKRRRQAEGERPGQGEESVRREWRELLGVRAGENLAERVAAIEREMEKAFLMLRSPPGPSSPRPSPPEEEREKTSIKEAA